MLLLQLTLYFSTLILWDSEPTGQGQGHMTTQQELPWLWKPLGLLLILKQGEPWFSAYGLVKKEGKEGRITGLSTT